MWLCLRFWHVGFKAVWSFLNLPPRCLAVCVALSCFFALFVLFCLLQNSSVHQIYICMNCQNRAEWDVKYASLTGALVAVKYEVWGASESNLMTFNKFAETHYFVSILICKRSLITVERNALKTRRKQTIKIDNLCQSVCLKLSARQVWGTPRTFLFAKLVVLLKRSCSANFT